MTTTKGETLAQENKGDKTKRHLEDKEEEVSKKKEHRQHHPFNPSNPPSAPTLQESFNNSHSHSHSHHSISDGDLQTVVASHSHSFSVSDGAIKVVKEEPKIATATTIAMMTDVEEVEEEETRLDGVSKKEGKWHVVLSLALRIAAFVFCKLAFTVLASDQRKKVRRGSTSIGYGYYVRTSSDESHWYNFPEFKYCLSVNIIGFVYSLLQICDIVKYIITKRHTVDPKLRGYFNFAMDQALAYLLMSASSTAATGAHYWSLIDSFAADKYLEMAKASVALSFLAFVAFASSSIVSALIFCRFN